MPKVYIYTAFVPYYTWREGRDEVRYRGKEGFSDKLRSVGDKLSIFYVAMFKGFATQHSHTSSTVNNFTHYENVLMSKANPGYVHRGPGKKGKFKTHINPKEIGDDCLEVDKNGKATQQFFDEVREAHDKQKGSTSSRDVMSFHERDEQHIRRLAKSRDGRWPGHEPVYLLSDKSPQEVAEQGLDRGLYFYLSVQDIKVAVECAKSIATGKTSLKIPTAPREMKQFDELGAGQTPGRPQTDEEFDAGRIGEPEPEDSFEPKDVKAFAKALKANVFEEHTRKRSKTSKKVKSFEMKEMKRGGDDKELEDEPTVRPTPKR